MTNVVGQGERRHPHDGNTTLTTLDLEGGKVHTPLWINQFSTDLNLQIDSAQLRVGLSHRPIRLTERMLMFTTLWNVADRKLYVDLIRKIREHWARNLNEDIPHPMHLQYYGANKTWRGFIEGAQIGYAVTDVILSYGFQMRIIPDQADEAKEYSRMVGGDAPYAPTSGDVTDFGNNWFDQGQFAEEQAANLAHSGEKQNAPPLSPTSVAHRGRRS